MVYGHGWEPDDPPEDPVYVIPCVPGPGFTCENENHETDVPATNEVRYETGDPETGVISRAVCDACLDATIEEFRKYD